MTSIALRRARVWGAFLAALAIVAGVGLVASPAFAAGPVYVTDGDIAEATSEPGAPGWYWNWSDDWDVQDDGLHFSIEGHGGSFIYVLDGHRYGSLEEIMSLLEGSGITVSQGELQWVCLGIELTMPVLPVESAAPSPSAIPSTPPESGSTVDVEMCLEPPVGVGTTTFTSMDTWGMCAGDITPTSDVFDGFENCDQIYTLEELFGLLTEFSPAVGIHFLRFGTEAESEVVVTQAALGVDSRFTADPGPELAETGPTIGAPVVFGGGLVLAGIAALVLVAFVRPRRS